MNKLMKQYKGAIVFYLIIIICIFFISMRNNNLNNASKTVSESTQVAFNN